MLKKTKGAINNGLYPETLAIVGTRYRTKTTEKDEQHGPHLKTRGESMGIVNYDGPHLMTRGESRWSWTMIT